MHEPSDPSPGEKSRTRKRPVTREDRLKEALKVNMARRKAQASALEKARAAEDAAGETGNEE